MDSRFKFDAIIAATAIEYHLVFVFRDSVFNLSLPE